MTYFPHLSAYLHRAVTSRVQESFNSWGLYAARWIQKKWLFSPINFCAMYCSCAVGGVSSVAILKIWENRESLLREIRRRFDSNETRQPEEHDERFDWEGKNSVSYENILSKSDRMMNILEQARYMDVPFIVTALSQTIIFYFGKIRRGKFLFTRPPCEVKQQAEAGSRTFFSRYFMNEYSEWSLRCGQKGTTAERW